jgi:hypothetical protein
MSNSDETNQLLREIRDALAEQTRLVEQQWQKQSKLNSVSGVLWPLAILALGILCGVLAMR